MERCIHHMLREACSFCNPRKPKMPPRTPVITQRQTLHGALALKPEEIKDFGHIVVHTRKGKEDPAFQEIDEATAFVHIDGHPFLWAIKEILKRGPNVKTIRCTPRMLDHTSERHQNLCKERNVQFVTGHQKPELAWEDNRMANEALYTAQRKFLVELQGEQKALFEELLVLGFEHALMAARYFCLKDEKFVGHVGICDEFGYNRMGGSSVGDKINSVFCYLDPTFKASIRASKMAALTKLRVAKFRASYHIDTLRQDFHKKHSFQLASNFPFVRLEGFEKILLARSEGRLDALKAASSSSWRALTYRFGLDKSEGGIYRTLEEVGEEMGGLTRERARQLEEKALEFLGIEFEGAIPKEG